MTVPLCKEIVTKEGVVITQDTRQALIQTLWPKRTANPLLCPGISHDSLQSYFGYYTQQCQAYLGDRGQFVTIRTHQDVADLVYEFSQNLERAAIRASLARRLQFLDTTTARTISINNDMLDRTIDLAARILLMVKIGTVPHNITPRHPLKWTHGTIRQFTRQQFDPQPTLSCNGVKLPKVFNARNLERIGGIKIKWTTNLADHLRMIDDDERVAIFGHPTFLKLHLTSDIFPDGFVDETLRTIKLLFPNNRPELKKWMQSFPPEVGKGIAACGSLRTELRHIETFKYWRDRLVVLKEVFDEAEPRTLGQWWWDRRKRVQWYTFWIAVLVLAVGAAFGVIQCATSIMQALDKDPRP